MKKLTRIAALLVALVLVLSLCACGGSDAPTEPSTEPSTEPATEPSTTETPTEPPVLTDDALVGTWRVDLDVTEMLNMTMAQSLGMETVDTGVSFIIPMLFTFNADGTYTLNTDEADFTASFTNYMSGLIPAMAEMLYAQGEAEGMDAAAMDEGFLAQYGMGVEDFLAATFSALSPEDVVGDMEETGEYAVEGNQLFLDGDTDYCTFEISGDKLTVTAVDGMESSIFEGMDEMGIEGPLVFNKVV